MHGAIAVSLVFSFRIRILVQGKERKFLFRSSSVDQSTRRIRTVDTLSLTLIFFVGGSDTLADSQCLQCAYQLASIFHQLPTEGEDAGPSIRGGKRGSLHAQSRRHAAVDGASGRALAGWHVGPASRISCPQ